MSPLHPNSSSAEDAPAEKPEAGAVRFSVSLPAELARELDTMTAQKGYSNRSLAISDMIRAHLVEHRHSLGGQIAGTITLLFDHHKPRLQAMLTDLQHHHTDLIVSTLHVHLDHDNCLEVLVVRGDAERVRTLSNALISAKGVKHGRLTVTATGDDLPA
ncbi:MAG TPA: nickel-responsive transcriptional regulator NikR [Abditibacterium sp.]|jgi:CopG family nickel-responsive transcriptional regulator